MKKKSLTFEQESRQLEQETRQFVARLQANPHYFPAPKDWVPPDVERARIALVTLLAHRIDR